MKYLFLIISIVCGPRLYSQTVLVSDNFSDRSKFIDNTLLTNWGGNVTPTTGLQLVAKTDNNGLTYNSVAMTTSAISHAGYTTATSLKTLTSFDYELPSRIDRSLATIKIEFDAIWNSLDGSGENGRLVVTLVDQYPNGGATFGQVDNTALAHPFGKPVYNIRLRNKNTGGKNSLMLYGAGLSTDPEWEIYTSGPWWLPGFSVQSGGGSPGSGTDYPFSGTICSYVTMASATRWRHFTWIIKPERLEVWHRNSDQPASSDVLAFFMEIPSNSDATVALNRINTAHGTSASTLPPYYAWHRYVEAVRFYFRGVVNTWVANVNITSEPASLLPIRLDKFEAKRNEGNATQISWEVPDDSEAAIYAVEHSADGREFAPVATLQAVKGRTHYSTIHNASSGFNQYRLKIVHIDGSIEYSRIIAVTDNAFSPNKIKVFPNPSKGTLNIQMPEDITTPVQVRVYDNSGKVFLTQTIIRNKSIDISSWKEGYYHVELKVGEKTKSIETIILSKK
jgi:hypothetical protein